MFQGGNGEINNTHTLRDKCAWWEVDLGRAATIETIKIFNREDGALAKHVAQDMFSSRLPPFYVMVSTIPYGDGTGEESLSSSLGSSVRFKRFAVNQREYLWTLPVRTVGRYVRIQLDGKEEYLHLAQVQVFGSWGDVPKGKPVGTVTAGRDVTVVTIQPETDPEHVSGCRHELALLPVL